MSIALELLSLAENTCKQIVAAKSAQKKGLLQSLLNTPQPLEWIRSAKSDLLEGDFYWNDIQLIEALMNRTFPGWSTDIRSHLIIQDKGKFASTIVVGVKYYIGPRMFEQTGIATSYAHSMPLLQLATPLSKSEAKKNAIKEIGIFYGRDLNRMDNKLSEIPVVADNDTDLQMELQKAAVIENIASMSRQEAADYVLSLPNFKYNMEIKRIINAKPLVNET